MKIDLLTLLAFTVLKSFLSMPVCAASVSHSYCQNHSGEPWNREVVAFSCPIFPLSLCGQQLPSIAHQFMQVVWEVIQKKVPVKVLMQQAAPRKRKEKSRTRARISCPFHAMFYVNYFQDKMLLRLNTSTSRWLTLCSLKNMLLWHSRLHSIISVVIKDFNHSVLISGILLSSSAKIWQAWILPRTCQFLNPLISVPSDCEELFAYQKPSDMLDDTPCFCGD